MRGTGIHGNKDFTSNYIWVPHLQEIHSVYALNHDNCSGESSTAKARKYKIEAMDVAAAMQPEEEKVAAGEREKRGALKKQWDEEHKQEAQAEKERKAARGKAVMEAMEKTRLEDEGLEVPRPMEEDAPDANINEYLYKVSIGGGDKVGINREEYEEVISPVKKKDKTKKKADKEDSILKKGRFSKGSESDKKKEIEVQS